MLPSDKPILLYFTLLYIYIYIYVYIYIYITHLDYRIGGFGLSIEMLNLEES